jgi:hypothetical protein
VPGGFVETYADNHVNDDASTGGMGNELVNGYWIKTTDDYHMICGLTTLLAPFPASEMTSHVVSYDVNHTKIDDEHLLRPVEPNLGVTPSLFYMIGPVTMKSI